MLRPSLLSTSSVAVIGDSAWPISANKLWGPFGVNAPINGATRLGGAPVAVTVAYCGGHLVNSPICGATRFAREDDGV